MIKEKDIKVNRILNIYTKLLQGEIINKKQLAQLFNVNEKTIQRDIDDIRNYFYENREIIGTQDVVYKRNNKGYCIENKVDILRKEDVLAIMKILLESRAFCKEELMHISTSIIRQVDVDKRKHINYIIGNELLNYVPTQHNEYLLTKIWELSAFIRSKEAIEIVYVKMNNAEVKRTIKPIAIIFSEYYFYLIAYARSFDCPIVFRIDRIKNYEKINEKFSIPECDRFEDGEFRKRIQFMYSGKLEKIKFEFWGSSIEAVLDRVPTAKIIKKYDNKYLVQAEVYGKGIIMWILSQGRNIKVLEPVTFVEEIMEEISKMKKIYEQY